MNIVKQILSHHFPDEQWNVEKPPGGLSKESYIATSESRKVFIKFDLDTPALIRLAEIDATPPILAMDRFDGRLHVIQEYVEGKYPKKEWFPENLTLLAKFINKYQNDETLRSILLAVPEISYKEHINKEIKILGTSVKDSNSELFKQDKFTNSIKLLKEQAAKLKPSSLVPIHADPNIKNILLTNKSITMVDWDDIVLSDPMRDVGLLLWWYVPESKWRMFFKDYHSRMDLDKIFWWVAARSLAIALWFDERKGNKETLAYLEDFNSALLRKGNPKNI